MRRVRDFAEVEGDGIDGARARDALDRLDIDSTASMAWTGASCTPWR
ncbi:MAG: hypothetical protein R3F59_20885 [Myxococcota bacterium]